MACRDDVLALTWVWDGVLVRWGVEVLVPGRGRGWRWVGPEVMVGIVRR